MLGMRMVIQRTEPFMMIMSVNIMTSSSIFIALSMTIVWHILCIIAAPRRGQLQAVFSDVYDQRAANADLAIQTITAPGWPSDEEMLAMSHHPADAFQVGEWC